MAQKEIKRLYRSSEEKIIAGVCGGLGEHLNVDPIWIRLTFVLLTLLSGTGIILYVILWILMPKNPNQKGRNTKAEDIAERLAQKFEKKKGNKTEFRQKEHLTAGVIFGTILVLIGAAFLLREAFNWFNFNFVWPVIIIVIGIYLILGRRRK